MVVADMVHEAVYSGKPEGYWKLSPWRDHGGRTPPDHASGAPSCTRPAPSIEVHSATQMHRILDSGFRWYGVGPEIAVGFRIGLSSR